MSVLNRFVQFLALPVSASKVAWKLFTPISYKCLAGCVGKPTYLFVLQKIKMINAPPKTAGLDFLGSWLTILSSDIIYFRASQVAQW